MPVPCGVVSKIIGIEMGKKESKKQVKERKAKQAEAKRKKQEAKALKKGKKKGGELGQEEEDDLEALLSEFRKKDIEGTIAQVEALPGPPSARSYFSVSNLHKNDEVLIVGGEYFDGDNSRCYQDAFRYNVVKDEWKKVIAPTMPPPRCSHQAVSVKERGKVYLFGGEFCTTYSFHHYRDFWEFDIETNLFQCIATKNGPSPRSGHRMLLYKHYLVLFGGFYETARGSQFFNDLHFFNLRTQHWFIDVGSNLSKAVKLDSKYFSTTKPCPRSACHFFPDQAQNCFYVYGGYTKSKGKGRNLDDLWQLQLHFLEEERVEVKWQKVASKGLGHPGKRSGACSSVFKNKLILFGGVRDKETQNDVEGRFFDDLLSFDMQRKRWYKLEPRQQEQRAKGRRRRVKDAETICEDSSQGREEGFQPSQSHDEDPTEMDDVDDKAFYYIENGEIIRIEVEEEEEEEEKEEEEICDALKDKLTVSTQRTDEEIEVGAGSNEIAVDEVSPEPTPSSDLVGDEEAPENGEPVEEVDSEDVLLPFGRIGAGAVVVKNELYVFFGTCEMGDYHVNFDDIWKVNVLKGFEWKTIAQGNWQGVLDKLSDHESDVVEEAETESESELEASELESGAEHESPDTLLSELKELREELDLYEDGLIPEQRESLRLFFKRTGKGWVHKYVEQVQNRLEHSPSLSAASEYRIQGKELRRKAFKLCQERYGMLAGTLNRLDAIEEAQQVMEKQTQKRIKIDAIKAMGGKLKKKG